MSRLSFLLSNHKHRIYKDYHLHFFRENLVFPSAQLSKGIGPVLISREYWNGEGGEKFSTHWESTDVAGDNFFGNRVTIHRLDNVLAARMREWSQRHPDDKYTDVILVGPQYEGLDVHIHLPTDQFTRLLQIDWKEKVLKLTVNSFQEFRLGLSIEQKNAMKRGKGSVFIDDYQCEVTDFQLEIDHRSARLH